MNLTEVQEGSFYTIVSIADRELEKKLATYSVFPGSTVSKLCMDDIEFKSLKISKNSQNAVINGSLAKFLQYKGADGKKESIYTLPDGSTCNLLVPTKIKADLIALGIADGDEIVIQKRLPHMEYITLINQKNRLRFSEALVACILGVCKKDSTQFSFSAKNASFIVQSILKSAPCKNIFEQSGIIKGSNLVLEGIEPGKTMYLDDINEIAISAGNGLRLMLSDFTASKISIK